MKERIGEWKAKLCFLSREINNDKTIISNPEDIAKKIDNFFASVGPECAKNIPDTKKTFQGFLTSHNEQMQIED